MKISIISDVHIQINGDERDKLISKFFNHPSVRDSDYIVLLGDIFDVMAGYHSGYIKMYKNFFENIVEITKTNKRVLYFEGNHDVHLKRLFTKLNKKLDNPIEVVENYKVLDWNRKKIYLSHGDDIELDNGMYESWKVFLKSKIAEYLFTALPFFVIEWIGNFLSNKSKGHSKIVYSFEKNKKKFRRSSAAHALKGYDYIFSGHSHVKDHYIFDCRGRQVEYANNGYAPGEKTFLYFNDGKVNFINLVES